MTSRTPCSILITWAGSVITRRGAASVLPWGQTRRVMLRNLAAVVPNYRDAGIEIFVVAYFLRDLNALHSVREALGVPLRVVRLSVPWPDIEQRLASDVTSGRRDDLRDAASSIADGEGVGVEDIVVSNDRPVGIVAREVMSWLGWL